MPISNGLFLLLFYFHSLPSRLFQNLIKMSWTSLNEATRVLELGVEDAQWLFRTKESTMHLRLSQQLRLGYIGVVRSHTWAEIWGPPAVIDVLGYLYIYLLFSFIYLFILSYGSRQRVRRKHGKQLSDDFWFSEGTMVFSTSKIHRVSL